MASLLSSLGSLGVLLVCGLAAARPNFVYILTDDTDLMLGSPRVLRQTRELIGAQASYSKPKLSLSLLSLRPSPRYLSCLLSL